MLGATLQLLLLLLLEDYSGNICHISFRYLVPLRRLTPSKTQIELIFSWIIKKVYPVDSIIIAAATMIVPTKYTPSSNSSTLHWNPYIFKETTFVDG